MKSKTKCFDWTIPPEWVVKDAYIITPDGDKICEFKKNNLHLLNYSTPINAKISLDKLQSHLYSLPNLPNAIPYTTSYYERRWGFCISQNERNRLKDGVYRVFIDTDFKDDGELNYCEVDIKATRDTNETILISTYLCHPQMANNELSGPTVWCELIKWLRIQDERRYNYKFIIIPETIGSICYISRNLEFLQSQVVAGFVLSCIGDERAYSAVLSPSENSLSDRAVLHTLKFITNEPKIYPFLYRGSDERQFNTPRLNLGVTTLCRSKFGEYKEYHTSLDDLNLVTPKGLKGGFEYVRNTLLNLEINATYELTTCCEPNLGSRGLIQTINADPKYPTDMMMLRNFLAFCNGKMDVMAIADKLGVEAVELKYIIKNLLKFELIKEV
ncbi:DUF4910 domain-containing protein [Campylobacter anatolicus]|uniref:DUF4910 domain-containing protein n=1 Tax=Campylobacter anatolicus TaxID=2829105 RepID=UPI002D21C45E|nr:DUF4910 domain-containing protein [Campylobacter anatolicus]